MNPSDIKKLIVEVNQKIDLHENDILLNDRYKNTSALLALKADGNAIVDSKDESIDNEKLLNYFSLLRLANKNGYFSSGNARANLSEITNAFEKHLFPDGYVNKEAAKQDFKTRIKNRIQAYNQTITVIIMRTQPKIMQKKASKRPMRLIK